MSWDFALILFLLLLLTGIVWFLDFFHLRARRRAAGVTAMAATEHITVGMAPPEAQRLRQQAYDKANKAPWWIEYCVSFFPVILFVFALRSFIVEPFRIPSGSMLPTLQNGDLILVNKFQYGIRLPVLDKKIVEIGSPRRGDVMVFRYPVDPDVDYIKRVVGLPGDVVQYRNKSLTINDQPVPTARDGDFFEPDRSAYVGRYTEKLGKVEHRILLNKQAPQGYMPITDFPYRENCEYLSNGVRCTVPPGHYFMMGDNRDNSLDSRYWGFVPDEYIVGRAFFIWMNFREPSRIGGFR
ncbi:signal peptidase I [Pollutimonas thiosulfatoxidans]|uniref:Signal peptidase I n=1 Tax=Pollutimonas thiosulfatoxidans TaxID=2028345 RepID=A0A410G949_9BURK|nr:signal peptidase I [Pollutimonas thiosulfatoxidans]MBF6615661.1 signal peptidase I [Candidimonas sp.]NYT43335.1 signal peptidase I [Alcaligenaceae bacterium]QAA92820.1 signal peptidase I [Pollutimonas thiosulfatoxidans]